MIFVLLEFFSKVTKKEVFTLGHIIALNRTYSFQDAFDTTFFYTNADVYVPETMFRKIVRSYLFTEEGHIEMMISKMAFSWSDVIEKIPNSYWEKFDLHKIEDGEEISFKSPIFQITVPNDEVLVDEDH